jgi:fructose-bisphosphate aldolase, class I
VLRSLFGALYEHNVLLEGTILKASMVLPGKDCDEQASVEEVAAATLQCLKSTVPAILPGIVFLSGGQSDEDATAHLDMINRMGPNPWPLSFSYGRAMQQAALKLWSQDLAGNLGKAQETVYARARDNGLAAQGRWGEAA